MKMMTFRKVAARTCALALCSAALSTAPMLAQGGMGGGGGRGMQMSPQSQLDAMSTQLSLTDDQKPKVLAVLEDSNKKMTDLRSSGGDPQEMRPKMMAIRTDQQDKIKALLTDEQKTKYDAMIQAQQQRMRGGQGGGQGGPPPQM
jgi:Spy/CpxP family protein refolding chaperone